MTSSVLLLLLLAAALADAIVPRACVHNVTRPGAICCPIPTGHHRPCGFPARGRCAPTAAHPAPRLPGVRVDPNDVRLDWPGRLFQASCRCVGRFWGVACEDCRYGYEGEQCQRRVVHVRRDISTYSAAERRRYLQLLNAARRTESDLVKTYGLGPGRLRAFRPMSVFEAAVNVHFFGGNYRPTLRKAPRRDRFQQRTSDSCDFPTDLNHNSVTFNLWHRYFILWWERQLRRIAAAKLGWHNFALPYWDYTDAKRCEVCTEDFICEPRAVVGQPFPSSCALANWTSYCQGDMCNNCESKQNKSLHRAWVHWIRGNKQRWTFPTAKETLNALLAPVYHSTGNCSGSFSGYISSGCDCIKGIQMHDLVHSMFPGDLATGVSSPNDPMFLFHHCQVDRLMQRWFLRVRPSPEEIPAVDFKKPQVCRNCALVGFLPVVTAVDMLVDLRQLGVTYDNFRFGPIREDLKMESLKEGTPFNRFVCQRQNQKYSDQLVKTIYR